MMKLRLLLLLPVWVATAFGAYQYDYTMSTTNPGSNWNSNGSVTTGFPLTFASQGSLILIPGVPVASSPTDTVTAGNSSDYEVNTTLYLKSGGGTFIHFLRANSDTVQPGSGSYIAVKLTIPSGFTSPGSATLDVSSCTNGTSTDLGSDSMTAVDGMTLRSVIFGTTLYVFANNSIAWMGQIPSSTGNPGVGGINIPSNSGFASALIGHHDVVAPGQVPLTSIESSVFPTSASLRWQGALDDPQYGNGIGVWMYEIYRSGVYLQSVAKPEFTDNTVAASTTYSYVVYAFDYHGNYGPTTQFSVTTPPATAVDPRRTGIYTTGSY